MGIGEGDDLEEAALFGMTGDDEFAGADEVGDGEGVGEGGHVLEAIRAVAVEAGIF